MVCPPSPPAPPLFSEPPESCVPPPLPAALPVGPDELEHAEATSVAERRTVEKAPLHFMKTPYLGRGNHSAKGVIDSVRPRQGRHRRTIESMGRCACGNTGMHDRSAGTRSRRLLISIWFGIPGTWSISGPSPRLRTRRNTAANSTGKNHPPSSMSSTTLMTPGFSPSTNLKAAATSRTGISWVMSRSG